MTEDIATEQAIALPEITDNNRRVVVEHTLGRMKGVMQIVGLRSEVQGAMPEFHPEMEMGDHSGPISLVGVKRSYYLYREITTPEQTKQFDVRQR